MLFKGFFCSLIVLFTLGDAIGGDGDKLVVYSWSDYIPEGVLADFTKETGIEVKYLTYATDEIMYQKLRILKGRGYDVLVPSTSLVARMRNEGLIQPVERKKLRNFKHLDPSLLNKPYDPGNNFSIPYLWGSTGIAVNTKKINADKVKSWRALWHRQWRDKIVLIDDMRAVFHIALKLNGHSMNTTDPEEIKQAYEKLLKLRPNIKAFSAEPHEKFASDEVSLGVVWNGEAVVAQKTHSSVRYIYPEEGASFWVDSFVIPARAMNVDNAHRFIDFMLRPKIAARCVKALGYATPNLTAKKLLPRKVRRNRAIFPRAAVLKNTEFQEDIGSAMELYLLYWGKLKAGG